MLYVLQELAVPGGLHVSGIAPEDPELAQAFLGIVSIYSRQRQYFVNLLAGLPVSGHGLGFGAVSQARLEAHPSLSYPADEFAVHLTRRTAPFPPVKDELGFDRINKLGVDTAGGHDIQGILAGCPVLVKGRRGFYFEGSMLLLTASPGRQHVLPIPVVGLGTGPGGGKLL